MRRGSTPPSSPTPSKRNPSRLATLLLPLGLALLLVLGSQLSGCSDGNSSAGSGSDTTAVANADSDNEANASTSGDAENSDDAEDSDEDSDSASDSGDEKEKKPKKEKTTSIGASVAVRGDLVVPVVAEGRVRARREAEMRAEISGRLDRVYVKEGDAVRRGALIARLDGREYEVAIDEARSRYLKALGQLIIEEEKVEGQSPTATVDEQLEKLRNDERYGKITREERLEAQREIEMAALREGAYRRDLVEARTGLSTAKADEERSRLNLERTEIRAPFSGVVTGLEVVAGERVSAGDIVCSIIDNVDVEAEVGVLESDLRGLEVGKPALLIVPALAETLMAQVDVISPRIDPDTRTCEVLIRYKSDDGRVRPGMFVRASIAGETHPEKLLVPREAILYRDGRPLLFRIDGDRAKWVYVTLGEQNDYVVEIKRVLQGGPVDAGTKVVVSDHLTLTDDAKVKIKKTHPIQDPWAKTGEES